MSKRVSCPWTRWTRFRRLAPALHRSAVVSDSSRPGNGNLLPPWKPGESGNPAGSSKRVRARAAAKRVSGLAASLRALLDQECPEDLLAELTPEQRAGLDGSPSLARYLAAKLVTSAAAASSFGQLLSALQLIATVDLRAADQELGSDLDGLLERFPRHLRGAVNAAFEAAADGQDVGWAFESRLHHELDEATRERMGRALIGEIDLRNYSPAKLEEYRQRLPEWVQADLDRIHSTIEESVAAAIAALDPKDRETLDRAQHEMRCGPFDDDIERMMAADGVNGSEYSVGSIRRGQWRKDDDADEARDDP